MPTTSRRTLMAGASAALAAGCTETRASPRVGVQLYTLRSLMAQDLAGTLRAVAAIGYQEVEFAGYFQKTPAEIRAILDANGLTSPSAHSADLQSIRNRFSQVLEAATVIGHTTVICASLPTSECAAAACAS